MNITEHLPCASVATKANVYFDGLCVSHSVTLADGSRKSVGVVLAAELTFNTGAAEIMECVAGACEYRLNGQLDWKSSAPGERLEVPANSSFEIRVSEAYHYICHFL
jgi:uncharacterized protein YaiE (UPF0345 family)